MSTIHWKPRLRAAGIHLLISLIVATLAAALVFGLWYPYPYRELSGGRTLFFMVVGIDVVLGPLITLLIFNSKKTRRHLAADLSVVGALQLAALCYGLWTAFEARPVHMVFEYQKMVVVHAVDIDPATLKQAPVELQKLPRNGPTLLSLRPFVNADEEYDSTTMAINGIAQSAQPALWQAYDLAHEAILQRAQTLAQLKARFPEQVQAIAEAAAATDMQADNLRALPLLSRKKAWTVLLDAQTAQPVGYIALDSF